MEIADREILLRSGKERLCRTKLADRRRRSDFLRAPTNGRSPAKCSAVFGCAIAEIQGLTKGSEQLDFLWVTEFPLLQFDATENKWNAVHHPFTRPHADDLPLLEEKRYGEMRAEAYDVVLNGVEIGGGSIRIHEPELQAKMFAVLGVSEEDQQIMFGHLLRAFRLGAPPHGGIALGLDRLVMLICGEESIREVMAFPKNNRGQDLMSQSPAEVDPRQLRDLGIRLEDM